MDESYQELGFAKLDMNRAGRTGLGETVFCPGKTPGQLAEIMGGFRDASRRVLGTKCSREQYAALAAANLDVTYDETSRLVFSNWNDPSWNPAGFDATAAVLTGGTADVPVAEEAAGTAEFFGMKVVRHYDVGVAGLHRLLSKLDSIRRADVVIAVAGMEGALGSVVSGLVEAPVVAVPTSVGYGASFSGVSALLAMLNSCAEGMTVVNIDNGFGAGVMACRIARMINKGRR